MATQGCRAREIKRPQKLCAGTARDYSTTFAAGCKDRSHTSLPILLPHQALEWKQIRYLRKELAHLARSDLKKGGYVRLGWADSYRLGSTTRIMPGPEWPRFGYCVLKLRRSFCR